MYKVIHNFIVNDYYSKPILLYALVLKSLYSKHTENCTVVSYLYSAQVSKLSKTC